MHVGFLFLVGFLGVFYCLKYTPLDILTVVTFKTYYTQHALIFYILLNLTLSLSQLWNCVRIKCLHLQNMYSQIPFSIVCTICSVSYLCLCFRSNALPECVVSVMPVWGLRTVLSVTSVKTWRSLEVQTKSARSVDWGSVRSEPGWVTVLLQLLYLYM